MTLTDLIAQARTGQELVRADGVKFHAQSVFHTLASGETLCCFIASKAPNSRGSRRGRHERIGFTYHGKEISRARALELIGG
jgi:hypothetical protein